MPVVRTQRRYAALQAVLVAIVLTIFLYGFWLASENPKFGIFGRTLTSEPATQRVVALTFDDGPNPPYTTEIVRWLKAHDAVATFFVVGRAAARYPEVVQEAAQAGDQIGNHTWDHAHLLLERPSHQRLELRRTSLAIRAATGAAPTLFRPPFGGRDPEIVSLAGALGMRTVLWSVPLAGDWNRPPARIIAARILKKIKPGAIMVLHDGNKGACGVLPRMTHAACDRSQSVEAVKLIVPALQAQGYRFVTVDELQRMAGPAAPEIENEEESGGGL
ncbi:polysaccharide deacetylase family protein [bacterium]|nr:MAG: polysaccharide deacetylase family protein [bacterium]